MPCPECGALEPAGAAACDSVFKQVCGHEFSNAALFGVHRITVDAYSLQHPARYMKSSKSAAAHLAGMCWSLEYGGGARVSRAISGWLGGRLELPRVEPPPPRERGVLTVEHVYQVAGSPEHPARVWEWARDVWAAWACGHEQARAWLRDLSGEEGMVLHE